jgi:glutamine amidotransferase
MTTNFITMIDYGGSNLRSVHKAFEFVGATVKVTADPDDVLQATKLVLPGVGAFGAGMNAVRARGLEPAVHEVVHKGIPFLGICVGMQFIFDESNEMGVHKGLGLLPGKVRRFPNHMPATDGNNNKPLKVPHIGWNQLEPAWENPLLDRIDFGAYTYFVHSYYCDPVDPTAVLAWTDYGFPFAAMVAKENVYGLQFHPEKSQKVGLQILRNFVELI